MAKEQVVTSWEKDILVWKSQPMQAIEAATAEFVTGSWIGMGIKVKQKLALANQQNLTKATG